MKIELGPDTVLLTSLIVCGADGRAFVGEEFADAAAGWNSAPEHPKSLDSEDNSVAADFQRFTAGRRHV